MWYYLRSCFLRRNKEHTTANFICVRQAKQAEIERRLCVWQDSNICQAKLAVVWFSMRSDFFAIDIKNCGSLTLQNEVCLQDMLGISLQRSFQQVMRQRPHLDIRLYEAHFWRWANGCSMNWFSPITHCRFRYLRSVIRLRQWRKSPMSSCALTIEIVREVKPTKSSNGWNQSHSGSTRLIHCRLWRFADACKMMSLFSSRRWVKLSVHSSCKWETHVLSVVPKVVL